MTTPSAPTATVYSHGGNRYHLKTYSVAPAQTSATSITAQDILGGTLYTTAGALTINGVGLTDVTAGVGFRAVITADVATSLPDPVHRQRQLAHGLIYDLPDGSRLTIDAIGNYTLEDASAKVVYQANWHREFNRYVNASDLVGEFLEALAKLGATKDQATRAPLSVFIAWLIHEAAKADGEPPPDDTPPMETAAAPILHPRCLDCGRFLGPNQRRIGLRFCSGAHADRYLVRRSSDETRSPVAPFQPRPRTRRPPAVTAHLDRRRKAPRPGKPHRRHPAAGIQPVTP